MSEPWIDPALPMDQLTEAQVLIATAYGEARSEPVEGLIAVLCCIRNRVQTGYRGTTYREVCLAPKQFSCWNRTGGRRNFEDVARLVRRMAAGEVLEDVTVREIAWLAHGSMKAMLRDTVKGARHYHVATMQPRPSWAQGQTPVVQRGGHVFYSGVS